MNTIKETWFLLKTLYRNNRGQVKRKNAKEKRSAAVNRIVGIAVVCVVFGVMFALQSFTLGSLAARQNPGRLPHYLTVVFFIAQAAILFLGLFSTLGTLYFSKDNTLLATLPVKKSSIFASKFLYCYFSELIISAAVVFATVTAFGVGAIAGGAKLSAWFFIAEIFSVFLVPVVPLLIIALLSIPMMYVVSLIKRSKIASIVLNTLIVLLFMAVCMIPSFMGMGMNVEGGNFFATYDSIASFTVFNLPLANSMFLIDAAANFFIYFGVALVGFLVVIGLSVLTYPKILASTIDSGADSAKKKKKRKKTEFTPLSFRKTYLKKELKTLFSTPTIVANLVLPIILLPVFIVLFTATGVFSGMGGEGAPATEFGAAGFILYLVCLVSVASNPIAMMGFSLEGKNIFFLKTLPVSAKEMVKLKLKIADLINLAIALVIFVTFSIASKSHDVLLAAILALVNLGFGVAFNRFGLFNDLKKPFLNWQNPQEINKNNKRSLKPMLICLGCCIVFLLLGFVFDITSNVALWLRYFLFAAVGIGIDALVYILTAKRLYDNANALWEAIEE